MGASPTVDVEPSAAYLSEQYKVNIDLWKHYDNLRQEKNRAFLQAQGFLVAALALTIAPDEFATSSTMLLTVGVSIVGVVLGLAWLTLQRRNAKYIKFHQAHALALESAIVRKPGTMPNIDYAQYATITKQQECVHPKITKQQECVHPEIKKQRKCVHPDKSRWPPSAWSSNTIDAALPCVTMLFWFGAIITVVVVALAD
jgi:hypothetical protein